MPAKSNAITTGRPTHPPVVAHMDQILSNSLGVFQVLNEFLQAEVVGAGSAQAEPTFVAVPHHTADTEMLLWGGYSPITVWQTEARNSSAEWRRPWVGWYGLMHTLDKHSFDNTWYYHYPVESLVYTVQPPATKARLDDILAVPANRSNDRPDQAVEVADHSELTHLRKPPGWVNRVHHVFDFLASGGGSILVRKESDPDPDQR